MKYLSLLLIFFFASAIQLTAAQSSYSSQGFSLNKRVRKARRLSEVSQDHDFRQWKEDDYEAIMRTMTGQGNLRSRRMQQNSGDYNKKPYYSMQQTSSVKSWQKIALATLGLGVCLALLYVCALRRELSFLNQYIPLGYKLFPDTPSPEEERAVAGVELQ